jgi:hypothetical protein
MAASFREQREALLALIDPSVPESECDVSDVSVETVCALRRTALKHGDHERVDALSVVLELAPLRLYPGLRIAQLTLHLMADDTEPYARRGTKYLAPTGPQASRVAWDDREVKRIKRLAKLLGGLPAS